MLESMDMKVYDEKHGNESANTLESMDMKVYAGKYGYESIP